MKALLWIAGAACVLCFGGAAQAKVMCNVQHLGYTKAQCDECMNMTWSVSRAFPAGVCVSNAQVYPAPQPSTSRINTTPPAPAKMACDIHHLGYTKAQCDNCTNMTWSVSRVFPAGTCVSTAPPQTINIGGAPKPGGGSTTSASNCTPTHWGGATIALKSPNFSGTGVPVTVCSKGYDLSKSQFQCSTGVPVQAFNYPKTNVSCNKTTAVGGNPQVTINGTPCCLN